MDALLDIPIWIGILVLGNAALSVLTRPLQEKENSTIKAIQDELASIDLWGNKAFLIDWRKRELRKTVIWTSWALTGVMLFLLPFAYPDPNVPYRLLLDDVPITSALSFPPQVSFRHPGHPDAVIEQRSVNGGKVPTVIRWEDVQKVWQIRVQDPGLVVKSDLTQIYVPSFYTNYDSFTKMVKEKVPEDIINAGHRGKIVRKRPPSEEEVGIGHCSMMALWMMLLAGLGLPFLDNLFAHDAEHSGIVLLLWAIICIGSLMTMLHGGTLSKKIKMDGNDIRTARRGLQRMRTYDAMLLSAFAASLLLIFT